MTDQSQGFSELLNTSLAEEAAKSKEEEMARQGQIWLDRVNVIASWLRLVFNDDSFVLLGYKLKNTPRKNHFILTVYVRVGNLVYGLENHHYRNRSTCFFGICVLIRGKSGIKTELRRLNMLYQENKSFHRLEFQIMADPVLDRFMEGPDSERMRVSILEEIVAATVNVIKRRPEQNQPETCQAILDSLPKHKHVNLFYTETGLSVDNVTKQLPQNLQEYLASVPEYILNRSIAELVPVPKVDAAVNTRNRDLAYLEQAGISTVRDVLQLNYTQLYHKGNNRWWTTGAVVKALSELDLELIPPPGREYLPSGVPKTVSMLLDNSGLKYTERPRNCLSRAQIVTTQQLLLKTEKDLLALTNFGKKSLEVVVTVLAQHNLKLASE